MTIRELLSDKSKWCTKVIAKDAGGDEVDYDSPHATCWCLLGALYKVYGSYYTLQKEALYKAITPGIGKYNDSHTYEEVITLVERLGI